MSVLDFKKLREDCTKIHFFGLGFIQVKMKDGSRYHFYHPDLPAFVENPHDHRYHFVSTVLKGTIENHIWKIVPEGPPLVPPPDRFKGPPGIPALLRYESCSAETPAPPETMNVMAKRVATFYVCVGSSYYLDEDTFHQASRVGDALITRLVRSPQVKEFASVLVLEGREEACPFSKEIPEEQLWEYVREMNAEA